MTLQFLAGITGLLIVIAVPITVAIPYAVRRGSASGHAPGKPSVGRSFLDRMRPHAWIGILIVGLSVLHAVVAMTGITSRINPVGLALAYLGIFVVIFQLALGTILIRPDVTERRSLRKVHFWTMITLVILGLIHILLDSPTIAHLIHR